MISALNKEFQNFEIIVVDDGSTDDLEAALSSISDPRIRLIRQENMGANAARNRGIDAANGDYVAFLDSDDQFLPGHLEHAVECIRGGHQGAIYGKVLVERSEGINFIKPSRAIHPGEHMAEYLLRDRGFVQTSTLVVPTAVARQVRYREGLPFGQDTDFAIRLFNVGVRFHMIAEPTAVWNDAYDRRRVSATIDPHAHGSWLETMRDDIPSQAYYADRGWHLAKGYARSGSWLKAVRLCLWSIARGCYPPRFAMIVALQVLMPSVAYRKISDLYLRCRPGGDDS